MSVPHNQSVLIESGETVSNMVDIGNAKAMGLVLPAAFTGTSIALYVAARPGDTPVALYDEGGSAVSAQVVQGTAVSFWTPERFPWQYVQLVSDATETGDRTILIALKD
jgi:hypothetical protein